MRIGHGYDVHRLSEGRKLILGGIEIPFKQGLDGHSDADVLIHSIIDALLGASGQGDIGTHFPDSDNEYKNISSVLLLKRTAGLLTGKGYRIINIDTTIVAQRPKLGQYIPSMITCVENALKLENGIVNIKATTEEFLGFTGSGLGISAHAVVLIEAI